MKRFIKLFVFLALCASFSSIFISKTYAWYLTVLIVDYVFEDGTPAADRYIKAVDNGDEYYVVSPYVKGYIPDREYISGTVFWQGEAKAVITYYPAEESSYELTINYIDIEGNVLANKYNATFEDGYNYNIESPIIDGYTTTDLNVSGTLNEDTNINVIYTKNKYVLQIDYINESNEIISDSYIDTFEYGYEYNIPAKEIYGYTPYCENLTGVITDNTNLKLMYSKSDFCIAINYVDIDGNALANQYYSKMKYESSFDVPSPIIDGYTPNFDHISGILDKDLEYTVTYSKNDYKLRIKYLDSDGNQIHDDYIDTLKYMDEYNIEVPKIIGYESNMNVVSGKIYNDTEIIVTYTKKTLTLVIHYIDICNKEIATPTIMQLKYHERYEIETKEIKGYYTNDHEVYGYIGPNNMDVFVRYHKCKTYNSKEQIIIVISTFGFGSVNAFILAYELIKRKYHIYK